MSTVTMQNVELADIPLGDLVHRNYAGRELDLDKVAQYADDIRRDGFNLAYRPHVMPLENGRYRLLNGHHRVAAATNAGMSSVPCLILPPMSDKRALLAQLQDNLAVRQDSDDALALAFNQAIELGATVEEIAHDIKRTPRYVQARLDLFNLDPTIRAIVASRGIMYAREIMHLSHETQRVTVRELAANPEWSLEKWRVMSARIANDYMARVQADQDIFSSGGFAVETWSPSDTVAKVETELAAANSALTYLGQTEIAARIGKSVQAVNSLRKRGQLPPPSFSVALGDLWASDVIDAWWAARQ